MFRLLLLLAVVGVAAYVTNPTEAAHSAKAEAAIENRIEDASKSGNVIDEVVGYVKGMLAGEGKYQNYYVASKYDVDMPGSSYVECLGAFTIVQCRIVEPSSN